MTRTKRIAVYNDTPTGKLLKIPYDIGSIKDRCVDCNMPFLDEDTDEKSEARYVRSGNYCRTCNAK